MKYTLFLYFLFSLHVLKVFSQSDSLDLKYSVIFFAKNKELFDIENGKYKLAFKYIDNNGKDQRVIFRRGNNKLNLTRPVFLIQEDAIGTPFYIYPRDSIEIFNNNYKGVLLKHFSNNTRTAELNFFSILLDSIKGFTFSTLGEPLETFEQVLNREKEIFKQKNFSIKFANNYFIKFKISQIFKEDCIKQISNFAFDDSLSLINNYRNLYIQEGLYNQRITNLSNSIFFKNISPLNNSDILLVEHFNNVFLFNKDYSYFKDSVQIKVLINHIENFYKGTVREVLLKRAKFLAESLFIDMPLQFKILNINDSPAKKSFVGNDKFLTTNLEKVTTLKKIILSQKESIILIDFWASWCQPCREEFKFSHELELQFLGKVKFLYFSIEEDVNSWIRVSKKEKLPPNSNFLMIETNSELKSILKMNTIPRYIIVDRYLNILSSDTYRPSSELLIQKLNELIAL